MEIFLRLMIIKKKLSVAIFPSKIYPTTLECVSATFKGVIDRHSCRRRYLRPSSSSSATRDKVLKKNKNLYVEINEFLSNAEICF